MCGDQGVCGGDWGVCGGDGISVSVLESAEVMGSGVTEGM